jgi:mannose-1-phosphate guanylyltransferase
MNPADQIIKETEDYVKAIKNSIELKEEGRVVMLDIN